LFSIGWSAFIFLDEPSIGLHQRDNEKLIHSLEQLRDLGNSVIVVEHTKI
jgi:excinuclease ABC subunit A